MMRKQKNVPSLRFSGFEGEWERKKLGEILTIGSGRDYKHLRNGTVPVYGTGGLMATVDSFLHNGETVCIGRKGTIDKPMYYDGKLWTVDTLFYTHSFNNSNPKFVYNLFQKINWKQHNEASGVPSLSKSTIEQILTQLPSIQEQQKIASFLTAIDEKLQALKQQKALSEQYKKAMMQKIFSQEIQFKDENEMRFGKWDMKKLGEVLIKNSQKNKDQNYNLVQSVTNKLGFVNQSEYFEGRIIASKNLSNYFVIKKGYFAYNPSRIDVGSLAYKSDDNISVISPLYISFNSNKKFLDDSFLLNWFNSQQFTKQMNSSFEGSVRNTLSYDSLVKIKIHLPSLPEQTKIANFLSALDEKINHCQVQIAKMEHYKKGLLQQLFV